MAEEAKQDDEDLSIEEILSSIRDIMSDEDEVETKEDQEKDTPNTNDKADAPVTEEKEAEDKKEEIVATEAAKPPKEDQGGIDAMFDEAPEAPAEKEAEDEVLELSDPIDADNADADKKTDEIEIEAIDITADEITEEAVEEKTEPKPEEVSAENTTENAPVSAPEKDTAATEVSSPNNDSEGDLISETVASASLASLTKLVADDGAPREDGSATIEMLTKDLLRPMLKDWITENLPDLIEKLVQKELRRLSLKSLDD